MDMKAISVLLAVCAFVALAGKSCHDSSESERYRDNYRALSERHAELVVRDSLRAAEVTALRLTESEMEERLSEDARLIRELTGRKKAAGVGSVTVYRTDTVLVAVERPGGDTTRFERCDEWSCVRGEVLGDTASLTVETWDDIVVTESLERKRLLFIPLPVRVFGYRSKKFGAVSKCPRTTVRSVEYISITD